MRMNPPVAWEYIRLLTGGTTCHHKKKVKMAMKLANGNLATNGKENMAVFGPHFERVFNNHRPVVRPYLTMSHNAQPYMRLTPRSLLKKLMLPSTN
jgi:hypothetical protein